MVTNNSLEEYIHQARKQHLSDSAIQKNLIDAGWDSQTVNLALGLEMPPALTVPVPPSPAVHSSIATDSLWNWDSFEHILMFLSLYTLVISIGITLYFFVDRLFPIAKVNSNYSLAVSEFGDIVLSGVLSAIIVSLPLFSFFFLNILSRTKKNPALRNIFARKRLIYITLIITFIIMVQNLIGTITSFLNGNLVANSMAHFTVIISLSLIVFIYFLNLVSQDKYAAVK